MFLRMPKLSLMIKIKISEHVYHVPVDENTLIQFTKNGKVYRSIDCAGCLSDYDEVGFSQDPIAESKDKALPQSMA